nr:hypothetical protein GCM10020241_08060 [Streptoalloteichus tenebrarius]
MSEVDAPRRARSARTRPRLAQAGDGHQRRRPAGSTNTPRQSCSGQHFRACRSAPVRWSTAWRAIRARAAPAVAGGLPSQPVARAQPDLFGVAGQERVQFRDGVGRWRPLVHGGEREQAQRLPQASCLVEVVVVRRADRGEFAPLQPLGEPFGSAEPLHRVRAERAPPGGEQVQPHGAAVEAEGERVLFPHVGECNASLVTRARLL